MKNRPHTFDLSGSWYLHEFTTRSSNASTADVNFIQHRSNMQITPPCGPNSTVDRSVSRSLPRLLPRYRPSYINHVYIRGTHCHFFVSSAYINHAYIPGTCYTLSFVSCTALSFDARSLAYFVQRFSKRRQLLGSTSTSFLQVPSNRPRWILITCCRMFSHPLRRHSFTSARLMSTCKATATSGDGCRSKIRCRLERDIPTPIFGRRLCTT